MADLVLRAEEWLDHLGGRANAFFGAGKRKSRLTAEVFESSKQNGKMENHSKQRVAEFLLTNAVDASDYEKAREEVSQMGSRSGM